MGQVTPTMDGIKQALNHRSLSQCEQWWLVGQVEILQRAADRDAEVIEVLQGVVADRERERDALLLWQGEARQVINDLLSRHNTVRLEGRKAAFALLGEELHRA